MKWAYVKRRAFLLIWLVTCWLAPSVGIHRLFMMGAPPPGSKTAGEPFLIPFGVVFFGKQLVNQARQGDTGDAVMIFGGTILPIIIYSFFLAFFIYYIYRRIKQHYGQSIADNSIESIGNREDSERQL